MLNRVLCQIRVLIKFIYRTPVYFPEVLLFYSTAVQKQNAIVRIRDLYETSKFHNPIYISFSEVQLFFVLCGKGLKCERRIGSFAKLGSFSNLNSTTTVFFQKSIYFILPQYRNNNLMSIKGPYETSTFYSPFYFGNPLIFRLMW